MTAGTAHVLSRRRGEALLLAIHEATLAELAETGFAGLTIERIAERAHTGKASIYRRWPTKVDLVVDALDNLLLPSVTDPPDEGDIRADLLLLLRRVAATLNGEVGTAARACIDQQLHPELAEQVRERLIEPRLQMTMNMLQRGVDRGEVRPEAVSPRIAEIGPTLLHGELMHRGRPIPDSAVVAIVDEVLLPLVLAQPRQR